MQAHPSNRFRDRRRPSTFPRSSSRRPRRSAFSRDVAQTTSAAGTKRLRSLRLDRLAAPIAAPCESCRFEPPTRARAATALRSLAKAWATALETADAGVHERASQVRDELHAVANRVGRLLETPGAPLAPIRIQAPTTASGSGGTVSKCVFIQLAADRLAELVDALSPEEWEAEGKGGRLDDHDS